MKPSKEEKIKIYRASLRKYEREGKQERVEIQKRLIKRIEDEK